ncbi:MAG: endonuclease/exonuclease/phosphatase family protein, partial [Clostridia bacterium]|nr:endonuclease/exonuclease/phosphatase family protein [Clostridia bacterium]
FAVLMSLSLFAPDAVVITDVPDRPENAVRVVSFNVRCKDDLYGKVEHRGAFLCEAIRAYAPDSFGVQEATAQWLSLLDDALGDVYARVGEPRNSAKNTEYSAVYYNKNVYTLLDCGTRWLSETPDEKGSKSFYSSYPRICTWATLQNKQTGRVYTHLNTHLDHLLELTREKQAQVLVGEIERLEKTGPVVCTGDFNTEEGACAYRVVAAALDDTKTTAAETDSGKTFHNYGRPLLSKRKPIDFIFVTKGTPVLRYKIIDNTADGMYLSDHFGLCADLLIGT